MNKYIPIYFSYHFFLLSLMLLLSSCVQDKIMKGAYEFTRINDFFENHENNLIFFNTDSGKKISIENEDSERPDIQFIRRAVIENKVIFVAYNPVTKIFRFAAAFSEDFVNSIKTKSEEPKILEITLMLRPSPLYLPSTHPNFDKLRKLLEQSKAKGRLVWVGTFPGDSKILSVRLASTED